MNGVANVRCGNVCILTSHRCNSVPKVTLVFCGQGQEDSLGLQVFHLNQDQFLYMTPQLGNYWGPLIALYILLYR